MLPLDFNNQHCVFDECYFEGRKCLFCDLRIKEDTLPEGLYRYDIRHEDENWGQPCQIQKHVLVNHYGCIITNKPIDLGPDGYKDFDPEDFEINGTFNTIRGKRAFLKYWENYHDDGVKL